MIRRSTLFTFLVLIAATIQAEGIPPEIANRIDDAVMLTDSDSFLGSYNFTLTTMVQKPNGKARHDVEMVVETTRHDDGSVDNRLVRMIKDGKDVTAAKRDEVNKLMGEDEKTGSKDDTEADDEDFVDPFGETASRYRFGPPRREDDAILMDFEPQPENREDDGMTVGTVAWNDETLDPLWMEMKALKAPGPLKELDMRMEFFHLGDTIFIDRVFTKGVVKILLITRQFETDMQISDIRPGVDQSSEPSMEMTIE